MTGLRDLLAEIGLGVGLQLAEDHRGDLLRRELLGLPPTSTSMWRRRCRPSTTL